MESILYRVYKIHFLLYIIHLTSGFIYYNFSAEFSENFLLEQGKYRNKFWVINTIQLTKITNQIPSGWNTNRFELLKDFQIFSFYVSKLCIS